MSEKLSMTVVIDHITPAQAIALDAMFRRWVELGQEGSSRMVGFYADGDGNFRPSVTAAFSDDPYPTGLDEAARADLRESADTGDEEFDFGGVAWKLD